MKRLLVGLCLLVPSFIYADANAASVCRIVRYHEAKNAFILKPGKESEFYALVRAKENMQALTCCVSCVVPAGTKVIITDRGMTSHSHTVRVLEGDSMGCYGNVPMEFVGECK